MADYPLGARKHHPSDSAMLLSRCLNVGVETRSQSTDGYTNHNAYRGAFGHTRLGGGRADGDAATNPYSVVPAYLHAHTDAYRNLDPY
ncbi:MAG: hypothetical protein ISS49_12980 [Anaerolineae bacterium]|nr:hypothetical protein [Anaerolineae bacterium]